MKSVHHVYKFLSNSKPMRLLGNKLGEKFANINSKVNFYLFYCPITLAFWFLTISYRATKTRSSAEINIQGSSYITCTNNKPAIWSRNNT